MNNILYFLTKALASGLTLAEIAMNSVLPNLYLSNKRDDQDTPLIYSGDFPNLYPQAYGEYLDKIGYMFNVSRFSNENDNDYRERIIFSISQNATKSGIKNVIETLLSSRGYEVNVEIFDHSEDFFEAENSNFDHPIRSVNESILYKISLFITPIDENKSVYYNYFENIFNVETFQFALDDIVSAGVSVEAVTFLSPGSGGEKGEIYAYKN